MGLHCKHSVVFLMGRDRSPGSQARISDFTQQSMRAWHHDPNLGTAMPWHRTSLPV